MSEAAYANLAFDAIERMAPLGSRDEITDVLSTTLADLGFVSVVVCGLPAQVQGAMPVVVLDCGPAGWVETYQREGFYSDDNRATHALTTTEPFRFADAPVDPAKASAVRRMQDAQQTFGVGSGLIVPTGRPTIIPSCVTMAGKDPDLQPRAQRAAQVIALYTIGKINALLRPIGATAARENLTPNEREVLQWTAAGKTSWEISRMQGVSEGAINKVIARAMAKLDAVTRTQAVVHAIRDGEIQI